MADIGIRTKKPPRVQLPAALKSALLDEVRSTCPSCGTAGVSKLEAHHIDGDRSRTVPENLIMLCGTCHGQADQQLINRELVADWKKWLTRGYHPWLDVPGRTVSTPKISVERNQGQVAETINNRYVGAKPPKSAPVPGTIEADPPRRDYVRYLVSRYIEWRKKGAATMGDKRKFSPSAAWNVVASKLGFAPYKAPVESFPHVVDVVTRMIDATPFGCRNRSNGIRNYHSFAEHRGKMGLPAEGAL